MNNWSEFEFVIDQEEQHVAMPGERTGWETVIFEVDEHHSDSPLTDELEAIYAYIDGLRDS